MLPGSDRRGAKTPSPGRRGISLFHNPEHRSRFLPVDSAPSRHDGTAPPGGRQDRKVRRRSPQRTGCACRHYTCPPLPGNQPGQSFQGYKTSTAAGAATITPAPMPTPVQTNGRAIAGTAVLILSPTTPFEIRVPHLLGRPGSGGAATTSRPPRTRAVAARAAPRNRPKSSRHTACRRPSGRNAGDSPMRMLLLCMSIRSHIEFLQAEREQRGGYRLLHDGEREIHAGGVKETQWDMAGRSHNVDVTHNEGCHGCSLAVALPAVPALPERRESSTFIPCRRIFDP